MIRYSLILSFILLFVSIVACGESKRSISFDGDKQAVARADSMFTAIGGKEAWCRLRSLYIKANHTEPQMPIPYTSEIWRAIDTFELIIEQQNDSFHVKAVLNQNEGRVRYLDSRDTFRILSPEQLADWEYGHKHNIYVLLHDLACDPASYSVEIDDRDRLSFYRDTVFEVSFGLDSEMRPYLFYQPNKDGTISGSVFTHWGTDNGLVHSAGGHPLDSNFVYRTEIWLPSNAPLKEAFGEELFHLD